MFKCDRAQCDRVHVGTHACVYGNSCYRHQYRSCFYLHGDQEDFVDRDGIGLLRFLAGFPLAINARTAAGLGPLPRMLLDRGDGIAMAIADALEGLDDAEAAAESEADSPMAEVVAAVAGFDAEAVRAFRGLAEGGAAPDVVHVDDGLRSYPLWFPLELGCVDYTRRLVDQFAKVCGVGARGHPFCSWGRIE